MEIQTKSDTDDTTKELTLRFAREYTRKWTIPLYNFLTAPNTKLVHLRIESEAGITVEDLERIFKAIENNMVLKSLDIWNIYASDFIVNFHDPPTNLLSLARNVSLISLTLNNTSFHGCLPLLADALQNNNTLQKLTLIGSHVDQKDLIRLHNLMSGGSTALKELVLAKEAPGEIEQLKEQIHSLQEENDLLIQKLHGITGESIDIPYNEITLKERIGEGGYGEVFKALWYGQNVAVKRIKLSALIPSRIESLKHESSTVMRLHHKHIVLPMGTTTEPTKKEIMLVMEYMKHGSLEGLLFPEGREPLELQRDQVLRFALDVAKGLNYLHCLTPKIIHRDLKCANILLYHNKSRAKISDFGTARFLNKKSVAKTFQGTWGYLAPEILEEEEYDEKADVYSFGIVLLVLATSSVELPTTRDADKLRKRINEILDTSNSMKNHKPFRKLVNDCCQVDPAKRPSIQNCIISLKQCQVEYYFTFGDDNMKEAIEHESNALQSICYSWIKPQGIFQRVHFARQEDREVSELIEEDSIVVIGYLKSVPLIREAYQLKCKKIVFVPIFNDDSEEITRLRIHDMEPLVEALMK